jgi:hypothetical protein
MYRSAYLQNIASSSCPIIEDLFAEPSKKHYRSGVQSNCGQVSDITRPGCAVLLNLYNTHATMDFI